MKHVLSMLPGLLLTLLVWSQLNGQISSLIEIIKKQNNVIEKLDSKILFNERDYLKKFADNHLLWELHLKNQHGLH